MKEEGVNLRTVLRHTEPPEPAVLDGEARLDALLRKALSESAANEVDEAREDPLERLRTLFTTELMPTFEELRNKYAPSGVAMWLDASKFLSGGRDLTFSIEFSNHGLRFNGTATENAIAFSQTRYTRTDSAGLTGSGPSLRTRDLDCDVFREFVCARIAALVQSVTHRR